MLDRNGDVITKVVPNRTSKTLLPIIQDNIKKDSTIHTDEHRGYATLKNLDQP